MGIHGGDSDYGHAVGVDPPNLRKLFSNRWFNGSICGFISNETYYNKDKSINEESVFEIWEINELSSI